MGREGVCQGEGGRATGVGKWAGVAGVASAAYRGQRVGFGQVFRCLDADVNFLQRFSKLATGNQLDTQPRVGIVGILLGPGV